MEEKLKKEQTQEEEEAHDSSQAEDQSEEEKEENEAGMRDDIAFVLHWVLFIHFCYVVLLVHGLLFHSLTFLSNFYRMLILVLY